METIQKRFLAFLLLCIPVRIAFVFIANIIDKKYLPYLGYLAILPALGFAYIFIFGKRKTGGVWTKNFGGINCTNTFYALLLDVL